MILKKSVKDLSSKAKHSNNNNSNSISPIREDEKNCNFLESDRNILGSMHNNENKSLNKSINKNINKVEAQFSEEENSLISKLTPYRSNASSKKTIILSESEILAKSECQSNRDINRSYLRRI